MSSLPHQMVRRTLFPLLVALALLPGMTALPSAVAATRTPAAATGLPKGIESLARYVPANSCNPTPKPGAVKFAKLLTKTYPGTRYSIGRTCGAMPNSEHFDGRAIDWMNSLRDKKQAAQAKAVLNWLFAKDKAGNPYANARRLGVMYIIWNNKIWGAYSAGDGWRPYSSCAKHPERSWDTSCHRDHMHISLSWEGAMGRTSFWSKSVAATDYGSCRPKDLSWASAYKKARTQPCPRYPQLKPPKRASATLKTLTAYSGMELRWGASGAPVTALQRAIKTPADGKYGARTKAAMRKWQTSHKIKSTGVVNHATWRELLRTQAPKP